MLAYVAMEIISDDGLAGSGDGPTLNVDRCIERFVRERKPCCASRVTGRDMMGGESTWGRIGDCRVRSDGTTLWSYDQPIARWRKRTLDIECRQFSMSTARHQDEVGGEARRAGVPTVCRRMAERATFEDPGKMEALGPDDPTWAEARRIAHFSQTAKGKPRAEAERRAERTRARADALMSDVRRMQAANRKWAKRYYEAAEWFAGMVEAMRMNAPRSWDEAKRRRGLAPREWDVPHPEVWTERSSRKMHDQLNRIKGEAERMLRMRRPDR